ncbi:low molecular weight phosphatase family protein [Rhodococcus sp. D-46]|uniref:arsenate reductase/protein-tyrosine-phosphatase family protein n=1 Tax=unclassified Rhodococcus (in: high G+C Gram-positive bacteria) TaxID=192944 RepID=UPI0006BA13DF|nr:protein-tyrosine-phosphatase [Rhodococcus sp. ADH]KPH21186.1 protein tyrosine phosphatase [Rhodococcus sp. ADH]NHE68828.1 low molecular weight phosphatase family protein [Rhodococcus sp. D-46]RGP46712.1 protein tyrosine phosphatase [Rhodococcus erythropolis]
MHVLFVCTGNICRSPTAERLANAFAHEAGVSDFTASSAGTRAVIGHPIELTAAKVLEGLGGTSGNFCARRLTARIASEADLILTMSERHRDKVLGLAPMQFKRTFTLREAARLAEESGASTVAELADARTRYGVGDAEDIIDPIGADGAVFQEVGSEIAELLGPLVKRLIIPSRRDLSPSAPATSSDLG